MTKRILFARVHRWNDFWISRTFQTYLELNRVSFSALPPHVISIQSLNLIFDEMPQLFSKQRIFPNHFLDSTMWPWVKAMAHWLKELQIFPCKNLKHHAYDYAYNRQNYHLPHFSFSIFLKFFLKYISEFFCIYHNHNLSETQWMLHWDFHIQRIVYHKILLLVISLYAIAEK